jgi:predicted acyltransferase
MSATEAVLTAPAPMPRLASLDVFRGVTIACMMLVNNPGSEHVYTPLEHADWHGWTFTDTVFPFFLWIVGVAMTLSFARRVERGADRGKLLLHALQRSAVIFGVGLLLNGFPYYHLSTLRIPGVLSRIAVCYLIAAAIFLFTKVRGQVIAIVVLLAGYWMLMTLALDRQSRPHRPHVVAYQNLGSRGHRQHAARDCHRAIRHTRRPSAAIAPQSG